MAPDERLAELIRDFLVKRWFLLALLSVLAVGFSLSQPLADVADRVPKNIVVGTVLFLMAVSLDATAIWTAMRRPAAVMLAVAINFLLLPLAAWIVSGWVRSDLAIGILIVGAVPSTLTAAAVWTRRAGGNDAVALLVTVSTNLACFVVTPTWLWITAGAATQLPLDRMIARLAVLVLLPTLLAQLVRLHQPIGQWATAQKHTLGGVAQCGILTIVFVGAIRAGLDVRHSEAQIGLAGWAGMLVGVVGLHIAMLAVGHAAAMAFRMPREDRIAVGFSGSQKTLMIGLLVALQFSGLAMLPMVAYHVCQLLVDTVVADWLRREPETLAAPNV